jgi:hypothetical protein
MTCAAGVCCVEALLLTTAGEAKPSAAARFLSAKKPSLFQRYGMPLVKYLLKIKNVWQHIL